MEKHKLVYYPDWILSKPCPPVEVFDTELQELGEEMRRIMKEENGIGIAAPQIGVSKAVICVTDNHGHIYTIANPEWTPGGEKQVEGKEGCLSFPGLWMQVKRWERIYVR